MLLKKVQTLLFDGYEIVYQADIVPLTVMLIKYFEMLAREGLALITIMYFVLI